LNPHFPDSDKCYVPLVKFLMIRWVAISKLSHTLCVTPLLYIVPFSFHHLSSSIHLLSLTLQIKMALPSFSSSTTTFAIALFTLFLVGSSSAQLSENFYANKCPKVLYAVKSVVQSAVAKEPRMGASLLRLFFHDCFVNVNYSNLNSSVFIYLSYIYYSTISARSRVIYSYSF